jgi:two-component system heavy metal sensor histidine kinase CusS
LRGEVEVALSKPRSEADYRDVLSSGLEECLRLSRLIDNLLFLARAENPKMEIRRERLGVAGELETLRDFYEAGAAEAGVTLALDAPAEITADLDRTLFQRAVGNLIDNALAYTDRGGTVQLCARQQDGALEIAVSDTGCGIPAGELPKLFQRFHRVDGSRTKHSGGQGLGLAIVQSIVTLHEGSVEISSEVGVGTRVTLQLPLPSRRDG